MTLQIPYLVQEEKKHSKANIPTALKKTVEDWIEKEGKNLGYGNFDQFLRDAAREKFLELTAKPTTENTRVLEKMIFRDLKGEIWKLMISDGKLHCEVCESVDCKHIKRFKKRWGDQRDYQWS